MDSKRGREYLIDTKRSYLDEIEDDESLTSEELFKKYYDDYSL